MRKAVGHADVELGDAVDTAGFDDYLVLPGGDRPGESVQLGDVLMLGAPVVEGHDVTSTVPEAVDQTARSFERVLGLTLLRSESIDFTRVREERTREEQRKAQI